MRTNQLSAITADVIPHQIGLFGINYKSASVALRGNLAARIEAALAKSQTPFPEFKEFIVVSTCNRFEVYFFTARPLSEMELNDLVAAIVQPAGCKQAETHCYAYLDNEALAHLLCVASGIDSLVLGETEILKQLRQARLQALKNQWCSHALASIFTHVEQFGAKLRLEIPISQGVTSITNLVTLHLKKLRPFFDTQTVLIMGVGEIGAKAAEQLALSHPKRLTIMNRTLAHATQLQTKIKAMHPNLNCNVASLEQLSKMVAQADIIMTATTAKQYVITPKHLTPANQPQLFIDLSVPHNIDPSIADPSQDRHLFDIDYYQEIARDHLKKREELIPEIRERVQAEIMDLRERMIQLENREFLTQIDLYRQQLVSKALRKFSQRCPQAKANLAIIRQLSDSLTTKLLYGFYQQLNTQSQPQLRQWYMKVFNPALQPPTPESYL